MRLFCAVLISAACLFAQDLAREGDYWVRTLPGSALIGPQTRVFEVSARATVVVRGSSDGQATYRLVERVKARTELDARRRFGSVVTQVLAPGGTVTRLVVSTTAQESVAARLEISVPRQLRVVNVETQGGDIEGYDLDGSLQAATREGLIRCDRVRGSVFCRTGGGEILMGKIGGALQCNSGAGSIIVDSAGGSASCETAGGNIVVKEAAGPLVLSTNGGNIQVERAAMSVEAHSAEGVIDVDQAGGIVTAETRGGSIQVGSARGVRCESAAGQVRLKNASGPLQVSTAIGSILAELVAGMRLEDSTLVAGSGDVTVMIPSNFPVSVFAQNDSGGMPRIISDFAEIQARQLGFVRPPLIAQGSINGGGPILRINVVGGTIYLRRIKQ